jgi:hypothetical protein
MKNKNNRTIICGDTMILNCECNSEEYCGNNFEVTRKEFLKFFPMDERVPKGFIVISNNCLTDIGNGYVLYKKGEGYKIMRRGKI